MIQHHPVFHKFTPFQGIVEGGFQVDFIGAKTRCEFHSGMAVLPTTTLQTDYPPVDEEYFEWIDILESVATANGSYTMIELGAGYGRWSVRAACALRQRQNIPFHLVAVEPEPAHFRWLCTHFRDNGVDPEEHTTIQAVVSEKEGAVLFYVGMPDGGKDRPNEWYGQAIVKSYEKIDAKCSSDHEGFELFRHKSGWKSIEIQSIRCNEVMRNLERVDLMDLDIQGEELSVVTSSINEIDNKVIRLHIGTHDRHLEVALRELLNAHEWRCTADYQCTSTNQTPWGPVTFLDGVQSWINPRLS